MPSVAGGDAAATGAVTVELQSKITRLAGLFARAVSETSKAVEDTVETAYTKGGESTQIKLSDLNPIDKARLDLTTEVNGQVAEIRALVDRLPGITSTTEQLMQQLREEEARTVKAGEALVAAQKEAKKWLAFVEDAESSSYAEQ